MNKTQGFTLLELLVTLSIVAILASMAVPAFNSTVSNSRLTSNTNLLIGALSTARSEAIRLGGNVRFESNGTGGWQLFDVTNNTVLNTFEPPGQNLTITLKTITYQANGYRSFPSSAEIIKVCDDRSIGRDITVSAGGGVSASESTSCP